MQIKDLIKLTKPAIVQIGIPAKDETGKEIFDGKGSGFLVSSEGHVVTCSHVIENLQTPYVAFELGNFQLSYYRTTIINDDGKENKDFAILKIDQIDISTLPTPLKLGNISGVEVGNEALFFGYPLKVIKITVHKAMLSAIGADILMPNVNILQIDGSVNNGNSGGPLVDLNGNVIGIITKKYSEFDRMLSGILALGPMKGVSIGNSKRSLDVGETFYKILTLMKSHVNVGIGHAFSIEYAKNKLAELKIL